MDKRRAIVVQRMIAAWNKSCETSGSNEDHMSAALDAALKYLSTEGEPK